MPALSGDLQALFAQKDAMEKEATELSHFLDSRCVGMKGSLLDGEGFPRYGWFGPVGF